MEKVLESRVHMTEGLAGAPGCGLHPEANEEPLTDMHRECLAFWSVSLHTARGPAGSARQTEGARQEATPAFQEGEMCWDWADCGALPPGPTEAP